ncbi:MAG TPA: SCP2 sterol-binding domain-containing protein [bacterium]|nr:SCP2 sterol-binding domain-containing protein [bacterium]
MGIRGASIKLSDGTQVTVESSDDDFTGELDARDRKKLVRELIRKIRDDYDGPVELARGARIVMYESADHARASLKSSFWDLFRPGVKRYEEIYMDPSATRLLESGSALLYGKSPDTATPENFFTQRLPKLLKDHAGDFASLQGTFKINIEGEGGSSETWFVKFPDGIIDRAMPGVTPDCTISLSESAARKAFSGDLDPLSYVFDKPSFQGNWNLAKRLASLLKGRMT